MNGYIHGDPFDEGMLPVGNIHQIYYAQYGLKDGLTGMSLATTANLVDTANI